MSVRKFSQIVVTVLLSFSLLTPSAMALSRRNFGTTRTRDRASTSGMYMGKQLWLPGHWTVMESTGELVMSQVNNGRSVEVRVATIPKQDCTYGPTRMRALKAWGGKSLEQSQARIETIALGTLKYKGYGWVTPSTWEGDQHFCVTQDLKTAFEITVPRGDTALAKFVRSDFLLQAAGRQGASTLPWPQASGQASSAPAK